MHDVSRRGQTLALGAGAFIASLLAGKIPAEAGDAGTLTIAFNVNVPSFDPTSGPSAVNPTIQAVYRSIFDQFVGQKPDLSFEPGLLTAWGWSDDKTKVWMDVRPNVEVARRIALHARGRRVVADPRRRPQRRQPDLVRLVQDRQTSRSTASASRPTSCRSIRRCSSGWRS